MILRVDDEGVVLVDESPLPGVFIDMEIAEAVRQDPRPRGGAGNGSARVIRGWEDVTVRLRLRLLPPADEAHPTAQLGALRALFRAEESGRPKLHRISHPCVDALGVQPVIFNELRVVDRSGDSAIVVELEFVEYTPPAPRAGRQLGKRLQEAIVDAIRAAGGAAQVGVGAAVESTEQFARSVQSAAGWMATHGHVRDWLTGALSGQLAPAQKLYTTPGGGPELDVDVP